MIDVEVARDTVTFRMIGIVSEADWNVVVSALEQQLGPQASLHFISAKGRKLHLLMDWEKLEGWEKGARSTCTWFCMGNQDMIDRLAIIGDERWRDETERLVDIYKNAQINFYLPAQREQAVKWINQIS